MAGQNIEGAVALVTGANRGIGRRIADALLGRGVGKLYAAARNPDALADLVEAGGGRVVALKLDVTDDAQVAAAAEQAGDVNLLINNAGVLADALPLDEKNLENAKWEFDVNVFGIIRMTSAFAPVVEANGGGSIVNLNSVASWVNFPIIWTYAASKAAAWSLTQGLRLTLADKGIQVLGVHPGPVETDMVDDLPFEAADPADVANRILDGIEAGDIAILPDAFAEDFGGKFLTTGPGALEQAVAEMAAEA